MKRCSKCGESKDLSQFHRDKRRVDLLYPYCRPCTSTVKAQRTERDAPVQRRAAQARRMTPAGRASQLCVSARNRALKKGLTFDLTPEWVEAKIAAGFCEVTRLPFDLCVGLGEGYKAQLGPSLDRVDPTRGYTRDNVQVVVWCYNAAKGTGTHESVLLLAEALCRK